MSIKVIIRVDDICDRYDFYDLKNWFILNFPQIPVSFYIINSQYNYRWGKKVWNAIKNTIINYNWEIGGHTRNHYHLPDLPQEKLFDEIVENLRDIENRLKNAGLDYKITSFAYPFGEFDERVKKILKENGIIHGLTYEPGEDYLTQLIFPIDNLYEIGISCNASNSADDWNLKFKEVFERGDIYILCLHTSHWIRGRNRENLKRIFKSRSIKELYLYIRRFIIFLFKKSSLEMWDNLKQHLEFILKHSDIQFITFKDLIK